MNERLKNIYKLHLIDYIKKVNPEIKPNEKKLIICPKKCSEEPTTQISHNKISCYEPECKYVGEIFDYIRLTKPAWVDKTDEDIGDYLQHLLKIEIVDDTDELLAQYAQAGFCLMPIDQSNPIIPERKKPPYGFMWKEKLYKNPKIWKDWIDRGWGLGLRLGKVSKIIAIDIDSDKTYEKVKHLLGDTLTQSTKRGNHYLYNYDSDFDFLNHDNLRDQGYEMEARANNAYIVIAPTSVEGELRKWNNKKVIDLPEEFKKFLLKNINQNKKQIEPEEEIQKAINENDLTSTKLTGLDGCCNDTFIKLGGILRKKMNSEQVVYTLKHFNALLSNPIDNKSFYALCNQIDKYQHYDKDELAKTILARLEIIGEGTAYQIACSLRIEVKDVEEVFKYLEDQGKVIPGYNRKYTLVNNIEWTTETNDLSRPVDFEIPYFSKYARFDDGNMIIIGGATGTGKTHLVGNIIKKLVNQGIKPYLINTEAGSKIGKITEKLKVPLHSYYLPKKIVKHPMDIELVDCAVTIIDWLKVKDGDYAKTDNTYEYFNEQLKKHGGILFIMTQLRSSNKEFFASDQVAFYGSLVCKYQFGDNGKDAQNTFLKTVKIRDSRSNRQYIEIPMFYEPITGIVEER